MSKKAIDLSKTLERCKAAWRAAQQNNKWRFTVFDPIYVGEENVQVEDYGVNSFNTSWEGDEIISFDTQGFDTIEGSIAWDECNIDELYEKLGFEPEYFSELEDGTYTLTNDQKRIIQEWKDENIEAELDFYWANDKGDSPSNRAEEAIREFCKRNERCIADDML